MLWAQTLDEVAGPWRVTARGDARVALVLDLIKREFPVAPPVAAPAAAVGLSPGRLIHLWKAEVGIPLRRYVRWLAASGSPPHTLSSERRERIEGASWSRGRNESAIRPLRGRTVGCLRPKGRGSLPAYVLS